MAPGVFNTHRGVLALMGLLEAPLWGRFEAGIFSGSELGRGVKVLREGAWPWFCSHIIMATWGKGGQAEDRVHRVQSGALGIICTSRICFSEATSSGGVRERQWPQLSASIGVRVRVSVR